MKYSRKALLLIAAILLIVTILPGCNTIPEEYTEGVKLDRDYPDDDMPIMKGAVVFYCEEDDDDITIRYGVEDDLDDVADFYKDHFDDNDIALDDETDNNTRYAAEGAYKDFLFELRATSPLGEYEKKVFETVVKIEIAFVEETTETTAATPAPENALEDHLLGFWRQESFDDGTGAISTIAYGSAYEFAKDGVLNNFLEFKSNGSGSWSVIGENTVKLTALDGYTEDISVTMQERDGKDYLTWVESTGTLVFYRSSMNEFMASAPTAPSPDEQLAAALADTTWYYVQYRDERGETFNNGSGSLIYYSDGTLEDTFDGETQTGSWHVENGRLYCDYNDGSDSNWVVEVKADGDVRYLYYYSDDNPGAYWLYADQPADGAVAPAESATYTSDTDIIRLIVDVTWNSAYKLQPDGSHENLDPISVTFDQDGTFELIDTEGSQTGKWYIQDQVLFMTYDETNNTFEMPTYIEYHADSDAYWIFFSDDADEHSHIVYTTYEP